MIFIKKKRDVKRSGVLGARQKAISDEQTIKLALSVAECITILNHSQRAEEQLVGGVKMRRMQGQVHEPMLKKMSLVI